MTTAQEILERRRALGRERQRRYMRKHGYSIAKEKKAERVTVASLVERVSKLEEEVSIIENRLEKTEEFLIEWTDKYGPP